VVAPDVQERLAALAARWDLPAAAPAQLATILGLVAVEPTSITTVRDPREGVERHIADALTGLDVTALRTASTIADLGSGAGFPGLALAAALPAARVTLVESVGKKVAFARRAAQAAGITNVVAVQARAEEWAAGAGGQDVVTARALAPLAVLVEYAAPLLREGGTLVAWKGARDATEEADGAAAAAALGVEPADVMVPPDAVATRHLYVYVKVAPTPPGYPRRAGMARKRPLGRTTGATDRRPGPISDRAGR
jgi:16S rRNA (guanine527-N7)-methyltransferase